MNLQEAYKLLELPTTATPEEAKKQYKKLASRLHPDVNKAPDAEAKFKKINEAYQIVESGNDTEPAPPIGWPQSAPVGFRHIYDSFHTYSANSSKQQYRATNIDLHTTISFKDSVQGCKIDLSYSRQIKCPHCQGSGSKPINNGCKKCSGRGQVVSKQPGTVFIQTCPDCHGKTSTSPCVECKNTGVVNADVAVNVSIPAFVVNGAILRLSNMGNFSGSLMGLHDQHTDVYLHIKVIPELGLRLEGTNIVSDLHISLLEALQGCQQQVHTISGEKEINIRKGVRNRDEVILDTGDYNNIKHRIIVNVEYPANIDKLIKALLEEGN